MTQRGWALFFEPRRPPECFRQEGKCGQRFIFHPFDRSRENEVEDTGMSEDVASFQETGSRQVEPDFAGTEGGKGWYVR